MNDLLYKTKLKIKELTQWSPKIYKLNNLIRLGSNYGGWSVPDNFLTKDSVCYLAGAGEDISFDVEIVEKYGCNVFIFDPTPRARLHYDKLIQNTAVDKPTSIVGSENEVYSLTKSNVELLNFIELGLWDKEEELKFYTPKDPTHVSHSAVNLQKTDDYFVAKVNRLSALMQQFGHSEIDLLKIDIEGAEYKVLKSIIEDGVRVKVLNIEFDEVFNPLDKGYKTRIKQCVSELIKFGYLPVEVDVFYNFTFVLADVYEELNK